MVVALSCDLNIFLGFALIEVVTLRHDPCRSVAMLLSNALNFAALNQQDFDIFFNNFSVT